MGCVEEGEGFALKIQKVNSGVGMGVKMVEKEKANTGY